MEGNPILSSFFLVSTQTSIEPYSGVNLKALDNKLNITLSKFDFANYILKNFKSL